MLYIKILKAFEKMKKEEQKQNEDIKKAVKIEQGGGEWLKITTKNGGEVYAKNYTTKKAEEITRDDLQKIFEKSEKATAKKYKKYLESLAELDGVSVPDFIKLVVNWTAGGAYGRQAWAELWTGKEYQQGDRTGGCGYDKESSAAAYALTKNKQIQKAIFNKLEKQPQKTIIETLKGKASRDVWGYGLGFAPLPYWEYGVGIESTRGVLEKLGYKLETSHSDRASGFYYFIPSKKNTKKKRGL